MKANYPKNVLGWWTCFKLSRFFSSARKWWQKKRQNSRKKSQARRRTQQDEKKKDFLMKKFSEVNGKKLENWVRFSGDVSGDTAIFIFINCHKLAFIRASPLTSTEAIITSSIHQWNRSPCHNQTSKCRLMISQQFNIRTVILWREKIPNDWPYSRFTNWNWRCS